MTTIFDDKGALNATLIECTGNKVSLFKNMEKDGYSAVQLEFPKTKKRIFKKEFRVSEDEIKKMNLEKDSEINVSIFEIGEKISVSGQTKAKGFQGVVKRHGFKGSPKTHGHKHDLRAPGSIGATDAAHVIKGKRMAGRMGGERSTSMNLKVVFIDKSKKIIAVEGAVPGIPGAILELSKK